MYKREETKLVQVPSPNKIPERDIDKAPILEVAHLGIDFGGLTAVDDFNIAIGRTEIAGLIGPNGHAGRSGHRAYEQYAGKPRRYCPYLPEYPAFR